MTTNRDHPRDTSRRRHFDALLRPLTFVGIVGMVAGGMLYSAAPAKAATPTPAKSASYAKAHSTGYGSLHGGHGSGKAVGRSTQTRTATPPTLTPDQQQIQARAAQMPELGAGNAQGSSSSHVASPTTPSTAAAARLAAPTSSGPAASTDFEYYRASNVSPGNYNSGTNEPSTANDGNNVLYTGNWYAAESTDSGNSFTSINPYTLGPTPSLPNGGFCCDQVAIHAPYNGITAWGLLYCPTTCGQNPSGDNLIRLAVARNQGDLASSTFDYYDFSAQTFGFPNQDWLDYPHFGVNNGYLMLTMNVFNGGSVQDSIMVKFDLGPFTSGGWSASWVYANQDFTWTPTDNSVDNWAYWGATAYNNGGLIRVYNWPPATDYTHVGWNDFSANFNYEWKNGTCTAPDGNNWCAFDDSRVKTGGEVGSSTAYFMWDAKQGGGFAYPYVDYGSFDVSTGPATSFTEGQIWNGSYAWAYPGMGVDGRGHLGVTLDAGGGSWGYPTSEFLIDDDISGGFAAIGLDNSAHANNRWGDYATARVATTGTSIGDTWIVANYTVHDVSGSAEVYPSFYWLGRQRDDPFAPYFYTDYSNSYTEGASANDYTGTFVGPSNCTCDYYAYTYWGDGGFDYTSLYNYSPTLFAQYGPHTYAEEGSYTTTWYGVDNWGNFTSGNGSASVADAALTGHPTTIYGAVGVTFTKAVAGFSDADPNGTVGDYTASIAWGDGNTSAGTIGSGFTVTGTHTYASTGTFTVKTTITDAGGATATVNSTANIGNLAAITQVSPNGGPLGGGQTVTITGSHFTGATAVKFGTVGATFTVVSDTKITAKTPAEAAGTVNVRVVNKYGTSKVVTADQYTYETAPTITGVSPTSGTHLGGTSVTITGTNFTAATKVMFGSTAATSFTFISSTKIIATSPAEATGTVNVRVTTPSGTSAIVAPDRYRFT